ncbi:MAG: nucleotidyltransferase domain-containing protein [Firmicutes bacterium]|nr:nucleotidyltransferase domain-containing protein [Bacillota bacterium]
MSSNNPEDLRQYLPGYEVWAFGSRVTGKAKRYSDLDLAVISNHPLDFGLLGEIRDAFSESDLPFKVDLVDWAATSPEFREIIKRQYEMMKEKE